MMNRPYYIILMLFTSCGSFDNKVLNDPRFASGREYGTNNPIQPTVLSFDNYTFVEGYDTVTSTLGMFYRDKEILFAKHSDGMFDTIIKANLNNDGIPDFLVEYAFEDGAMLLGLLSQTRTSFKEKILSNEISDVYCNVGGDTSQYLQPLLIKDINNDNKDEIIVNLCKMNGVFIANSCTDTLFADK